MLPCGIAHEPPIGEAGSALVRPRLFFYRFGLVQLVVLLSFGGMIIQILFDSVGNIRTLGPPFPIPFQHGRYTCVLVALLPRHSMIPGSSYRRWAVPFATEWFRRLCS